MIAEEKVKRYISGYNEYDDSNLEWFDAETFGVETVERGWIGDNLPPSKEERLRDLKEELEYLKIVRTQLQKIYNSLMPFTLGMVGHLPRMEKKMSDMVDYVEPKIRHYNQLIDETQEQINRMGV